MEYINSLQIDSLKGVRKISFHNLPAVTLITGPNGSGKSTVLDAVELLANPMDPMQYVKLTNNSPKVFYNLFDKKESQPRIRIAGEILEKPYFTELVSHENNTDSKFSGYHFFGISKNGKLMNHTNEVSFLFKDFNEKIDSVPLVNVKRISEWQNNASLNNIAKDKLVKEKLLSFLSLFDNRFTDIYSPDFHTFYISHEVYGNLEESFFSDGIRKIIKIADAMSHFHNGILLIDDLESHLSPKTLYETVSFLYALAKEKQIQLFFTTHSQELIDEWLDMMNFYNELSHLKIIRMKLDGFLSSFYEFSGKEAYELRLEKELDFRYEYPKKGETNEGIF